ncbi:MAG: M23 family metallopeptidase [Chloroflexota bacterium]
MDRVSPVTGKAEYPGDGWIVTSGYATEEYFQQFGDWHTGHDLAKSAEGGELIYAIADGIVKFAAFAGEDGFGNLIFIKHNDNQFSRYAHLREISVSRGEEVTAGQVIGRLGTTGRSTGNHLHFDVMVQSNALDWPAKERMRLLDQYIDPYLWFEKNGMTVDPIEPVAAETMRVFAPAGLNVRRDPRINGKKLHTLEFGTVVEVKPFRVTASGFVWQELVIGGWVAAKFLERVTE